MSFLKTGCQLFSRVGRNGGRYNLSQQGHRFTAGGSTMMRVASYRQVAWQEPTHDELPIPEGSWDVAHKKKQQKYGRQLFLGAGFFVFTVFFMFSSGIVQLNATIPKLDDAYLAKGSNTCPPTPPPKC